MAKLGRVCLANNFFAKLNRGASNNYYNLAIASDNTLLHVFQLLQNRIWCHLVCLQLQNSTIMPEVRVVVSFLVFQKYQ